MLWLMLSVLMTGTSCIGTYAYLTDDAQAENKLGITGNEIHIEEQFELPEEVIPGCVITKRPSVVNDSDVGVYVRMAVKFTQSAAEDFCLPLEIHDNWERKSDGYYYYKTILAPNQSTAPLFEKLVIKKDLVKDDLIPFDLLVYAESVQSMGMDRETAWNFFGFGTEGI